jgi:phosphatidylethanolamine-binding protein (PEBP) family uncharacterized protein
MRGPSNAIVSAALITVLALSGCGGASSSTTNSKAIALVSPAMAGSRAIPIKYTCDGKDVSLPLRWSNVPPATEELALFLFDIEVAGPLAGRRTIATQLTAQWAVVGLKPTLHELPAGRLPPGTVLGRNGSGRQSYSVCPAKGKVENYLFLIYALPSKAALQPGFTDATLFEQASHAALAQGRLFASYKRV